MKNIAIKIQEYIKKQPISALLVLTIWVMCLVPVPESPMQDVPFFDKWTHLVMYGVLVLVVMTEYGHRKSTIRWKRFLIFGFTAPVIMGGLVELAQAYLTFGTRSGDWLDALANATGAVLGAIIGIPLARFLATRNKGD